MSLTRGRYRATPDTLEDKQWTDLRVTSDGSLITSVGYVGAVVPGTDATSLGKAEDAPHASGDTGVMMLGVRNTGFATPVNTDGDYSPISVGQYGGIFVDNVLPGTGGTSLGKFEDAAHTTGDVGVMVLGVANTGATAFAANGDYTPIGVSLDGGVYVGSYSKLRATTEGQVKASAGVIHSISIAPLTATPTAGLLTVYDNTAESGTVVYSEWVFATTPGHTIVLDAACGTGIYVGFDGTLANVSYTVTYR